MCVCLCMYVYVLGLAKEKKKNYVIFRKTDKTGDHHFKQNKQDLGKQILQVFSYMWTPNIYMHIYIYMYIYIHVYIHTFTYMAGSRS